MSIRTIHEPQLLGTAGTLIANKEFFQGDTGLLIHADNNNAMEGKIEDFLDAHLKRQPWCKLTMLTFRTKTPESCGIVEIDRLGV